MNISFFVVPIIGIIVIIAIIVQVNALLDTLELTDSAQRKGHFSLYNCLVLGHTKCGAVEATITGKALPSNMSSLSAAIQPALKGALQSPTDTASFELIKACCEANVRYQMKKLRTDSKLLAEAEKKGELTIMGAMYDVDTGRVQFLD